MWISLQECVREGDVTGVRGERGERERERERER